MQAISFVAYAPLQAEGQTGTTSYSFVVGRSGSLIGPASVDWSVTGLMGFPSPANAQDFVGGILPGGTITFLPGEETKTIVVDVRADTTLELDEAFRLTLSNPSEGVTLDQTVALGLILNDDPSVITGDAANNVLRGTATHDLISGLDGADRLLGGSGNDTLLGGSGLDTLDGGLGADSMEGGAGDDSYVVDNAGDVTIELAGGGHDRVTASLNWTLGAEIERLTLSGTGNLTGTGNALDNRLDGNAGANTLDGGAGNDSLNGGAGNDVLLGGAGTDVLAGEAGADRMEGGAGDDTYVVDNAGDTTVELAGSGNDLVKASVSWTMAAETERLQLTGSGNLNGTGNALGNRLDGNAGMNRLDGDAGNDTLFGDAGQDHLLGGTGHDMLIGGTGADSLEGGAGDDIYIVDQADDVVVELAGGGDDQVQASVNWTLGAQVERLLLSGSGNLNGTGNALANLIQGNAGANRLEGGAGDDTMGGGIGQDTLVGGAGKDRLSGGLGADRLEGGLNADRFIFATRLDAQGDVVADFSAAEGDRIDLRRIDANTALGGDQEFTWIGGSSFSAVAGQLRYAGGVLAGDLNGDGTADFQVTFENGALFTSANIWL